MPPGEAPRGAGGPGAGAVLLGDRLSGARPDPGGGRQGLRAGGRTGSVPRSVQDSAVWRCSFAGKRLLSAASVTECGDGRSGAAAWHGPNLAKLRRSDFSAFWGWLGVGAFRTNLQCTQRCS